MTGHGSAGTTLPYASFATRPPAVDGGAVALAAAGRCRVDPATCHGVELTGGDHENDNDEEGRGHRAEYRAIVAKAIEQASVDVDDSGCGSGSDANANKKLKKKYMKQGVALARSYLTETLGLDPSVIDVEIVLASADVTASAGLLAACFLDAGCDRIVLGGTDVAALDAARIPRDRLVAQFDGTTDLVEIAGAASRLAGTVSIRPSETAGEADAGTLLALLAALTDAGSADDGNDAVVPFDVVLELAAGDADAGYGAVRAAADKIGTISAGCGDRGGGRVRCFGICLIDPTVQLLGLSYAACLRTDRDDGLFTTVVCTRSGEALGLVYSSKVSEVCWRCFLFPSSSVLLHLPMFLHAYLPCPFRTCIRYIYYIGSCEMPRQKSHFRSPSLPP